MITELDFFDELTDDEESVGTVEGRLVVGKGSNGPELLCFVEVIMWLWGSRLY